MGCHIGRGNLVQNNATSCCAHTCKCWHLTAIWHLIDSGLLHLGPARAPIMAPAAAPSAASDLPQAATSNTSAQLMPQGSTPMATPAATSRPAAPPATPGSATDSRYDFPPCYALQHDRANSSSCSCQLCFSNSSRLVDLLVAVMMSQLLCGCAVATISIFSSAFGHTVQLAY